MIIMAEKMCNKCGNSYPHTAEFWPVRRRNACGLDTPCRQCCRTAESKRREKPEVKAKNKRLCREWYARNPKATTKLTRLKNYGVSAEDYRRLLESQGGVCAICGKPETAKIHGAVKDLAVDHCHKTGRIRGLLCSRHNTALGLAGDDPHIIEKMAAYLRQHEH